MKKSTLRAMIIILAIVFILNVIMSVYGARVNADEAQDVQNTTGQAVDTGNIVTTGSSTNNDTNSVPVQTAEQNQQSDTAVSTAVDVDQTVDKQAQQDELLSIDDNSYVFKDIQNHWAKDSMLELSYMEILKGFDDKTMKPANNITREEFIAMLVRAIGMPTSGTYTQSYRDMPKTKWSFRYIAAAKKNGLLDIYKGSYIYPQKAITREEMAVIASKVLASVPNTSNVGSFKDIKSSYIYKSSIDKVSGLGIINGMPDGSFKPKNNATRAEAAAIIGRMLKVKDAQSSLSGPILKATVINYEKSVYNSPNVGDYLFKTPISNSVGKEKNQNTLRSNTVKRLNSRGINSRRYVSDESVTVDNATKFLAEGTVSYNVIVEADNFTAKKYSVTKKIYLKKSENKWVVYNETPDFKFLENIDRTKKINLTWQNLAGSTPNMTGKAKIDGLNVISPTWFHLTDGNGTVKSIATSQYVEWAHSNGYKIWPLLGNEFDSAVTSSVLASPQKRAKVISSMIAYANQYKFDGINVDFENMYTKDKDMFTLFVRELTQKAKENNLVVSVDVTVIAKNSNWSECYDRAALSSIVDYVALMAYDQHWVGSQDSGSVAQVTWVDSNIKKTLNEIPAHKLVLGMPFYTRIWKEDYSSGSTKPVVTSEAVSMAEAEKRIAANNADKVWDAESGQYYSEYTIGNSVYKIWLEDEESIRQKVDLVTKYNLAGASSWRLGYETPDVWAVIADALGDATNL